MILDQHGNPIESVPDDEDELQTARVLSLHREFALHPGRGLTPSKLARILEDAERGDLIAQNDLGDDLEERDGHIHAELSKRRRAILTTKYQVEPPRHANAAEKRAAEFVADVIEDMDVDDILLSMGDAIHKGFAPLEIDWRRAGKHRLPRLELKPQRWFQLPPLDPYTDEIRLRNNTVEGEALIPGGWIVHLHKAKPGYLARASLARILAWPYLFKNYSTRDMAEFLEIYGLPLRLGKYPRGSSDAEKSALMRAVMSIGHAAGGIVPQGMEIDFQEATKGASDPFSAMIDWCERTESKAILGQTLSAESKSTGLGSGVANLQSEVRTDILKSDARQMAQSMSDLCYLIAVFNGFSIEPDRGPQFRLLVEDAEDLTKFSTAIPKLVDVGAKIPESWMRERLRIPEAKDGEAVLARPQRNAPTAPAAMSTRLAALASQTNPEAADIAEQMADQLDEDLDPEVAGWIEAIRELVDQARSLEEVRDGLLQLYPDMQLDEYALAMSYALAAAELRGRNDIVDDADGA